MLAEPTLVFVAFLTLINVCASKTSVGSFITRSHDVRGEVYFTDDDTTLEIKDFYYDGKYLIPNNLRKNPYSAVLIEQS